MSPIPDDPLPRTVSRHDPPNLTAPATIEHLLQLEGLVKGHEAESEGRLRILAAGLNEAVRVIKANQPVYVFSITLPFIGKVPLFTIHPQP